MDLEELKKDHPDLYAQVVKSGEKWRIWILLGGWPIIMLYRIEPRI